MSLPGAHEHQPHPPRDCVYCGTPLMDPHRLTHFKERDPSQPIPGPYGPCPKCYALQPRPIDATRVLHQHGWRVLSRKHGLTLVKPWNPKQVVPAWILFALWIACLVGAYQLVKRSPELHLFSWPVGVAFGITLVCLYWCMACTVDREVITADTLGTLRLLNSPLPYPMAGNVSIPGAYRAIPCRSRRDVSVTGSGPVYADYWEVEIRVHADLGSTLRGTRWSDDDECRATACLVDEFLRRRDEMAHRRRLGHPHAARERYGLTDGGEGVICPECRDPLDPEDEGHAACEACHTLHHAACFERAGGCKVHGCHAHIHRRL